jgi:hypothetical protein
MDGRKDHSLNWLRMARALLAATLLALLGSAPAMAANSIGDTAGQAASGLGSASDQVDNSAATLPHPVQSGGPAAAANAPAATQSAPSPATGSGPLTTSQSASHAPTVATPLPTSAAQVTNASQSVPAPPPVKASGIVGSAPPASAPVQTIAQAAPPTSVPAAAPNLTGSSSAAVRPVTPLPVMGTATGASKRVSQLSTTMPLAHGVPLPGVAQPLAGVSGSTGGHTTSAPPRSSADSLPTPVGGHVPALAVPARVRPNHAKTPSGTGGALAFGASAAASLAGLAATTPTVASRLASTPGSPLVAGAAQRSFPSAPAPAPEPLTGGSSPSSAAAAAVGFLIFLGLAGLLVLGAPSVARRLRLAGESCGASAFVLIPERPG